MMLMQHISTTEDSDEGGRECVDLERALNPLLVDTRAHTYV